MLTLKVCVLLCLVLCHPHLQLPDAATPMYDRTLNQCQKQHYMPTFKDSVLLYLVPSRLNLQMPDAATEVYGQSNQTQHYV
jgi:hypothetical protein